MTYVYERHYKASILCGISITGTVIKTYSPELIVHPVLGELHFLYKILETFIKNPLTNYLFLVSILNIFIIIHSNYIYVIRVYNYIYIYIIYYIYNNI